MTPAPFSAAAENAVVLYRVSSGGQDEGNQIPDVTAHCEKHAYNVVKVYELNDISASKGEQDKILQEILDQWIRPGRATVIVIAESSRLDRRERNTVVAYLMDLDRAGGRIESAREPNFHLRDMLGWFTVISALEVNHQYTQKLSENTTAGLVKVRANGALDGMPAWGYEPDPASPKRNRKMIPTADGEKYIPLIYAKVIEGYSVAAIARWLDSQGVTPPGAGKNYRKNPRTRSPHWWPKSVHVIVTNPAYKGERRTKNADGSVTVHQCPPLVDAVTWRQAQNALTRRPKRGKLAVAPAMLATAITCGDPGCDAGPRSPMYRTGTAPYQYYRCAGRGPHRAGCGNLADMAAVDAAVNHLIPHMWNTPVIIYTRVKGNGDAIDEAIEKVHSDLDALSLRRLDRNADRAERERLYDELERLEAATRTPDTWDWTEAAYTYAQRWAAEPVAARGPWLTEHGFTVAATREQVTVTHRAPDDQGTVVEHRYAIDAPRPRRRDAGKGLYEASRKQQ